MLLVLIGCATWLDEGARCDHDPYEWSDDLLAHILHGDGSGAFDYDPDDVPRSRIAGSYDPESGDFSWDVTYVDSYWRQAESVVGYGTAYHTGDLDILYTDTVTDILGTTTVTDRRVNRAACDMQLWSWPDEDPTDVFEASGSYEDDSSFSWTSSSTDWTYKGSFRQNLSSTFHYVANDGTWDELHETAPEGTTELTSSGTMYCDDGLSCETTGKLKFDGSYEATTTEYDGADVYATITTSQSYAGDGTAHYVFTSGVTCDVTYSASACTYTCDDGENGDCS